MIDENQYHLGTSIGISVFPHGHGWTDTVTLRGLRQCTSPKNWDVIITVLHLGIDDPSQHRYALERNLRRALVEDEFLLYYQAKVNLDTKNRRC